MSPVRRSFKWWKRDSEWKTAFHTRWHIQPLNGYVAINVDWLFLMTTFQLRFDIHLSLFICVCLDGFFVDATTVAITNNNDNFFSFVVIFVCSSLFLFYVFFFFFWLSNFEKWIWNKTLFYHYTIKQYNNFIKFCF